MFDKIKHIDFSLIETLFPFHFLLDKNLCVVNAGVGLKKILPGVENKNINEFVSSNRPYLTEMTLNDINEHITQIIILKRNTDSQLIRGQFLNLNSNYKLFIGSPWITSTTDLKKNGLTFLDFPLHDNIPELLHVMQSQEFVMKDMKMLLDKLNIQKEALEKSEKNNFLQFSISQILVFSISLEETMENVIEFICSFFGWKLGAFWIPEKKLYLNEREGDNAHKIPNEYNEIILVCKASWQEELITDLKFKNQSFEKNLTKGIGFPGEIWKKNEPIWLEDISYNLESVNRVQNSEIKKAFGFPVLSNDETVGIFELYGDEKSDIDNELIEQYRIISNQISQYLVKIKALENVTETEKKYKQLVEEANDIIYTVDVNGYFTYANPITFEKINISENTIIGKHFSELVAPEYKKKTILFYLDQLENKVLHSYYEFVSIDNDGKQIWIGQNASLTYEDDNITGFHVVARDITEIKNFENQLKLEKINAENSRKIKEQFLANMSHEIRTPMNAIVGMVELIDKSNFDLDQKECIETIKISAENLLVIINDILDFSKIESGKMLFEEKSFVLNDVLNDVYKTLNYNSSKKGLDFKYSIVAKIETNLFGDPTRLRQILLNLCNNAIKFTEKGSISIIVDLLYEDENCIELMFKVVDTGIGISEDKVELIFESFTQASNETTRKFGGTGLGLTIVKQLVELQGGKILLISKLGKGSTFQFNLSFKKDLSNVGGELLQVSNAIKSLKDIKILLAEDNPMNQLLAKKVFKKWDCILDIAENGEIAIQKHLQNEYDLILMDIQMPEIDGLEATSIIRNGADSEKACIPIMAMTAHAIVEELNKCLDAGMNDVISKPFNQDELYNKIIKLITSKK